MTNHWNLQFLVQLNVYTYIYTYIYQRYTYNVATSISVECLLERSPKLAWDEAHANSMSFGCIVDVFRVFYGAIQHFIPKHTR